MAGITSHELSEWMAYERVAGPLGGRRIDVAAAVMSAVVANSNRDPKSRAVPVEDFLVNWDGPVRDTMSPEGIWAQVKQAHSAFAAANGRAG